MVFRKAPNLIDGVRWRETLSDRQNSQAIRPDFRKRGAYFPEAGAISANGMSGCESPRGCSRRAFNFRRKIEAARISVNVDWPAGWRILGSAKAPNAGFPPFMKFLRALRNSIRPISPLLYRVLARLVGGQNTISSRSRLKLYIRMADRAVFACPSLQRRRGEYGDLWDTRRAPEEPKWPEIPPFCEIAGGVSPLP